MSVVVQWRAILSVGLNVCVRQAPTQGMYDNGDSHSNSIYDVSPFSNAAGGGNGHHGNGHQTMFRKPGPQSQSQSQQRAQVSQSQ